MIELTEQQQHDLHTKHEHPPRLLNPTTGESFILLPAEMYERVRTMLEEEDEIAAIEEMYPLLSDALEEGTEPAKESA